MTRRNWQEFFGWKNNCQNLLCYNLFNALLTCGRCLGLLTSGPCTVLLIHLLNGSFLIDQIIVNVSLQYRLHLTAGSERTVSRDFLSLVFLIKHIFMVWMGSLNIFTRNFKFYHILNFETGQWCEYCMCGRLPWIYFLMLMMSLSNFSVQRNRNLRICRYSQNYLIRGSGGVIWCTKKQKPKISRDFSFKSLETMFKTALSLCIV